MRNKAGLLLFLAGCLFVAISIYQYVDQQIQRKHALQEADKLLGYISEGADASLALAGVVETPPEEEAAMTREQFNPQENDVIGILRIPKLDKTLPILEGTDEETLDRGVGHFATTAFPTDNEQILLSGHRDTVFTQFDKLAVGDSFIVEMPYGSFEYVIKETEIVDEDDTSVIRPMGEEVLTVTTCYPFRFIGNAPQRYVIYAYPITPDEKQEATAMLPQEAGAFP
ncbi:class D sortase [Paenibacillus senegalensis]|uniref:class D sortase n=1 Tax=Paenibacillus senegalensis TaxID=1465766 RepID=UPI0002882F27|nr:class D sortase [Paenibacillus senegalensis]